MITTIFSFPLICPYRWPAPLALLLTTTKMSNAIETTENKAEKKSLLENSKKAVYQ